MPPRLLLQCWDSDMLGSDDFIGNVILELAAIFQDDKVSSKNIIGGVYFLAKL